MCDVKSETGDRTQRLGCEFEVLWESWENPIFFLWNSRKFPLKRVCDLKKTSSKIGSCTAKSWMSIKRIKKVPFTFNSFINFFGWSKNCLWPFNVFITSEPNVLAYNISYIQTSTCNYVVNRKNIDIDLVMNWQEYFERKKFFLPGCVQNHEKIWI